MSQIPASDSTTTAHTHDSDAAPSDIPPDSWETLAAAGRLDDAAVAYVREHGEATPPELQRALAPHMTTTGDWAYEWAPGVSIAEGLSEAFAALLKGLFHADRLFAWPCSWLTWSNAGGVPNLPIAKNPPPEGYSRPHWLPVVLKTVPLPDGKRQQTTRERRQHAR